MLSTVAFILIAALVMGLINPLYEWNEKRKFEREMDELLKKSPGPDKDTPILHLKK